MALIRRLLERPLKRDLTERDWMRGTGLWSRETASGRTVTPSESLQLVAVQACVRVLAETIGTLPLPVYRNLKPRGRVQDRSHPLYAVLHDRPNPEMTSVEWRECMMGHLALRGNAYSQIVPLGNGGVELWPLRPDRMRVVRLTDRQLGYLYTLPSGEARALTRRDILHIRGLSPDGLIGYSPVTLARESIGLGLALEEFGSRLFGNGAEPGGVLQTAGELSDPAYNRLKTSWEEAHKGLENAHRIAILEEGIEWKSVSLSGRDAQWIEQRKFQRSEIASIFRVLPHLIGDLERATFSNIENQSIDFVVHTIRPWLVRWEQALARDILTEPTHSAKFIIDGLLRGDTQTRWEAYVKARQNGVYSANDIREFEDQNPLPPEIGDVYIVQLNMVPVDQLGLPSGGEGGERAFRAERAGAGGSAASRLRLADRYERLFAVEARRLVNREVADVRTAAGRYLNRRDARTFLKWLRDYYGTFGATATRQMLQVMSTYGEAVLDDAAAEIDSDDPEIDAHQAFIRSYAKDFGEQYAESSLGQLEQVLSDALAAGEDEAEAIGTRLDEWAEKRPRKVSTLEVISLAGALCLSRWKRGGIRRIRWVVQGGKSCRFCRRLGGQVVGIEETFANSGDEIEGGEGQEPLKVHRKTAHPPIHGFCKCGLRPEGV